MADPKQGGTHWRSIHRRMNEHLLFAEDLGGVGGKVDVEVIDSGVALVKGAEDSKNMPWLAFCGHDGKPKQKRLALNATNAKTMQSITGTGIIEQWRGWITLIVLVTSYYDQKTKQMESTEAIRIAPKRPQRTASSSPTRPQVPSDNPKDEVGSFDRNPAKAPPAEPAKGWNGEPDPIDEDEARELLAKEAGRG